MRQDIIDKIKTEVEREFENGGYKLKNTHFENGRNLHSKQYYYVKRFFQNSENCKDITKLLCYKLNVLKTPNSTTLIGFRNYTGLLLNTTIHNMPQYNYAIIEQVEDTFTWQHSKNLKDNLVIILPITCTCSTFIKLRKFLADELNKPLFKNRNITIDNNFINVFSILEKSLECRETECIDLISPKLNESESNINLSKIYSAFNWVQIKPNQILIKNKRTDNYVANSLVRLYSELYLPESCPLCFPTSDNSLEEKPLFPTDFNFETPNLIFGFPNFSKETNTRDFFQSFNSIDTSNRIHLYGNTEVNHSSYLNYIRGNEFYDKNKNEILKYFEIEISKHLKHEDKHIIFITAENKHNSNFLEDISLSELFKNRSVTILRFEASKEFIDNFISLHSKTIKGKDEDERKEGEERINVKVIYFEEVISGGKTFKLISNYIKHSKDKTPELTLRHGFDLVLTLVDRTLLFTKYEIIKKIYSTINRENPENKIIAFYTLNVPIISASHLGNPLKGRVRDLRKMIEQCHLDFLKIIIGNEVIKQQPRGLPELEQVWNK